MKLPARFVVLLEGTLWRVKRRSNIVPQELPHLLGQMLNGHDIGDALDAHGIRLTIEEDTDDGPPDGLIDGRSFAD